MRLLKALSIAGVILFVGVFAWPQHGTTPGSVHGQPGLTPVEEAEAVVASIYDDATAIWTFNEINGLGYEGNDGFEGLTFDNSD
ncbi:unnamed protein product, partial [marine sediment metagenome]